MNLREALEKLSQLIRKLEAEFKLPPPAPPTSTATVDRMLADSVLFSYQDLGGMHLLKQEANEYRDCVDAIYTEVAGKTEHVSRSAIETFIQRAMLKAINPTGADKELNFETRLSNALDALREKLKRKPTLWEVHFQVEGLEPSELPHTFGECEFYNGGETYLEQLSERINVILASRVEEPAQEQAKQIIASEIRKKMAGRTGVRITLAAVDIRAAQQIAEKQIRLTVDILNFYGNLGNQPVTQLLFFDAVKPGVAMGFVFSETPPSLGMTQSRVGPIAPFSFARPDFETLGFSKVSKLLRKSNPSKLEDKVLSALQWAGRASVEQRKEEAFLLFAIALEGVLMSSNDNTEIIEKLALRGAHLIVKKSEARVRAYKDLKKLYGIRSKIVHSGSVEVTKDNLAHIRFFVQSALLIMLCTGPFSVMTDEAELIAWFQDSMLGVARGPSL